MKGYKYQTKYDTKKNISAMLILKVLPYGKWITNDQKEFLFNRDYEPIAGWNLKLNVAIPVIADMWIHEINEEQTHYYYNDGTGYPTTKVKIMRECTDVLAYWSQRSK